MAMMSTRMTAPTTERVIARVGSVPSVPLTGDGGKEEGEGNIVEIEIERGGEKRAQDLC